MINSQPPIQLFHINLKKNTHKIIILMLSMYLNLDIKPKSTQKSDIIIFSKDIY